MSNTYYTKIKEGKRISLTAFVGKNSSLQITIGKEYIQLSDDEARELSKMILKRASGQISATE